MPAGISWGQYLGFCGGALLFTVAGAQTVHGFYKPLENLDNLVQEELRRRRKIDKT